MCGLTILTPTSSSPPFSCISIYSTHICNLPSASSSNSCGLLLVSSRQPRGLLGSCCSPLFMPVFVTLSLSALFLRVCSGHSVNRACHCPATFPCSLFCCAPAATSWTDRYSSRELSPPEDQPPLKKVPCTGLKMYINQQHTWCWNRLDPPE